MKAPKHVGIIMDGNRRLAKRLMKQPWKGHEWGKEKLQEVLKWSQELGVKELTVYAFSIQNFNRPDNEFTYLMKIMKEYAEEIIEKIDEINEQGIKITFAGQIELFPEQVTEKLKKVQELTKNNSIYRLNVAAAYGGREEMLLAMQEIGKEIESGALNANQITQELVSSKLFIENEPEMIIRTGGEHRTSNFLIWQSHYSEWFFLDTLWPEFSKKDFANCIELYKRRDRRFGA